jgi:hypothetical protein
VSAPVLLTHSRTRTLRDCAKRHQYRYELRLAPADEPEALRMGSAYHAGLEAAGNGQDAHGAVEAYYEAKLAALPEERHRDLGFEQLKIHELLRGWLLHYSDDGLERIATELPFELMIPGIHGYRNAGKIDGLVRLADGRVALLEHKTTAQDIGPASPYWDKLRLDSQITRYFAAARQLGRDVQTVVYDVTRKPTINPRASVPDLDEQGRRIVLEADGSRAMNTRTGEPLVSADSKKGRTLASHPETFAEYAARLRAGIEAKPEAYFARMEIPRLRADVEAFESELADSAREHRFRVKSGVWPRNDEACHRMGRRECEYLALCTNHIDCSERVPDGFVRLESAHPELEEA